MPGTSRDSPMVASAPTMGSLTTVWAPPRIQSTVEGSEPGTPLASEPPIGTQVPSGPGMTCRPVLVSIHAPGPADTTDPKP